ncbi:unnamed protein product [Ectocarpus sp. CCAP 1310/34]|nr:unnamed protein product [Ectocarpus sp. CCAP 1310/34]
MKRFSLGCWFVLCSDQAIRGVGEGEWCGVGRAGSAGMDRSFQIVGLKSSATCR